MEAMSCRHDSSSALCHSSTDLGGGVGGGGDGAAQDFFGLFGDRHYHSSGDLFDLVWQGASSGGGQSMEGQPSCNPLSRPVAVVPERLAPAAPPSEAEMASWLFPIVCGQESAGGRVVADQRRAWVDDDGTVAVASSRKESVQERKISTGGRRSASHHHAEAHSLTEKRRRWKINDRFKTLQKLVPGCDNSNQVSTLDQTIRYMKSLQQQIQALTSTCGMKPTSAAVYPVVLQAPCSLPPAAIDPRPLPMPPPAAAPGMLAGGHIRAGMYLGLPPAIIPFAPVFPLVHHPTLMMHTSSPAGAAARGVEQESRLV